MAVLTPAMTIPVSKGAKFLVRLVEEAAYLLLNDLVDQNPQASSVADLEWRYAVLRFSRPPITGAVEDYAQMGINLINITGGDVDTSWTAGDYTTCDGHFAEFWTGVKGLVPTGYSLYDVRYYRRRFADTMTPVKRFADSGPPLHIYSVGSAGTNVGTNNAQQVAASITLKTPVPRHWGRLYFPGLSTNSLDTYGRWASGTRTVLANMTAELVDDLQGSEFFPVVPVTQVGGQLVGGLLGVTSVQVDDVPDVVRRRRAKTTLARTIGVPTA